MHDCLGVFGRAAEMPKEGLVGNRERAVIDFLHDEKMTEFIAAYAEKYTQRDVFNQLPFPEGADADELWEIVNGVRRMNGTLMRNRFTRNMTADEQSWVNEPAEMKVAVSRIMKDAGPNSFLERVLGGPSSRGLYTKPFCDEISSALKRDGFALDADTLSSLLRGYETPVDEIEKVVVRARDIILDRETIAAGGLDLSVFSRIRDRLIDDAANIPDNPAPRLTMPNYRSDMTNDEVLEAAYETWDSSHAGLGNPISVMISNADVIWQYRPFGVLSALTELVFRSVYAVWARVPGLAFCPFGYWCLKWENDELPKTEAIYQMNEQGFLSSFGRDVTPYFAQTIRLVEKSVDQMRQLAEVLQARSEHLHRLVDKDWRLNHRQVAALREALDVPESVFTVREYGEEHGVSVVTARTDLQKLVDFDYLFRREEEGKTLFLACPDIRVKLASLEK